MFAKLTRYSLLLALIACVPVLAQETTPPAPAFRTPEIIQDAKPELLDQEGAGKLFRVGEHLVCVMEGAPREMGFQHGRLLAGKIREIMRQGYMVNALYNNGYTAEYINAQSDRMQQHFPPEYIEEMQGIVEGCRAGGFEDVTYEEVRGGVTMAEILHHDPNTPPGCSNFAVWGQWTTDGRLLHGRNLDWDVKSGAQNCAVTFVWRPKGGWPFMMTGWAGSIGSVSGMSAKGLTIGEMTSSSTQETFNGLPLFLIMRRILEKADSLEQAVAIMERGPRTTGWNFIIGDGKALDGRALEVDAVDCAVFGPMDPKENAETGAWAMPDCVRRTNHPISMTMIRKLVALHGPEYGISMDDLQAAIPLLQAQNTWQRYDWMGKTIQAQPGKIDVPQALQILANGPVYASATLHSWVFDPKNKTAYVALAGPDRVTATDRPFTRIDLAEWFE